MTAPVVLITGAAKRLGAGMAKHFHQQGYSVVVSYQNSEQAAQNLVDELNQKRKQSAYAMRLNLSDSTSFKEFAKQLESQVGRRLDVLINNASAFYPTPFEQSTESEWAELIDVNVKAAYFLSQALHTQLSANKGCIINMVDIYAQKPLKNHPVYSISKAAMAMLTQSLALELAPAVRVNGISPGAILWPENSNPEWEQSLLEKIPLQTIGSIEAIAKTAYLLADNHYITGQIIAVDGGRSLNM